MGNLQWVATPTFLYRNYLYEKIVKKTPSNKRFLLIGTGTGYFLKKLQEMGYKGVAIDISSSSVAMTRMILDKEKIVVKNTDIFKYRDRNKFDLVFSFEVIEHIRDDQKVINKIYKLLNNNGKFIMSVPARMRYWGKIDEIGGHYRRYEKAELISLMTKPGFKISTFWTYGFPFLNIIQYFSRSGRFIKNIRLGSTKSRIKRSGIRIEYDPKLSYIFANTFLLKPLFIIMDWFLHTDLGLGYILVAKK